VLGHRPPGDNTQWQTPLIERLEEQRTRIWNNEREFDIARSLLREAATALSLAQTEIKGHMRVEDELKVRVAALEKALDHILWVKDCGIDGTDETGTFRNWPETERDQMYDIAKVALKSRA
jgi:hypothetical protein